MTRPASVHGGEFRLPDYPSVVHMLQVIAGQRPDACAMICGEQQLSYAEYAGLVAGLASRLDTLGARGERIAVMLGNSIEMAIALFAAHAVEAQVVPINPLYTEREVSFIVQDAQPRLIICGQSVTGIIDRLGLDDAITTIVVNDEMDFLPAALKEQGVDALQDYLPAATALATLQYTGGTTGRSKGVNISHTQMMANIAQRDALLPVRSSGEVVLCVMPLFHVFAVSMCLHLACYAGATLVILPRYRPDFVLEAIQEHRVTAFPAAPTIYTSLLNFQDIDQYDLLSLTHCYSGSAPLPQDTLDRWRHLTSTNILEGYGQSEAGPLLTSNPADGASKQGSVGIPVPGTTIEIVDTEANDRVLDRNEIGEIRARGPQIMAGYRNLPAETAEALRNGWLYTGDMGEIDDEGYIFIRDRKKDMVIVGGFNVYPREIDEILFSHPQVMEAATVGISDHYYGEIVIAFVVANDSGITEAVLYDYCQSNLAKYKIPKLIRFCEALPKTPAGKIDKVKLRLLANRTHSDSGTGEVVEE